MLKDPIRKAPDLNYIECPWNLLDREPPKMYERFLIYLDLPKEKRTWAELGRLLDTREHTVRRWAVEWAWEERAAAWMRHTGKLTFEDREEIFVKSKNYLLQIMLDALKLIANEIRKLVKLSLESEHPVVPLRDLTKLADFALKLDRISQMQPSEIVELKGGINIVEERRLLQEIVKDDKLVTALDQAIATIFPEESLNLNLGIRA